jgi:hypothetical protein
VYCATYNRRLWRSEDAGETWLPVGTPQRFFEGPAGGAIEPRETTFVSVDPVPQTDGRHAVWVSDCRWSIDVGESARGSATIHRIQAGGVNVFYREAGPLGTSADPCGHASFPNLSQTFYRRTVYLFSLLSTATFFQRRLTRGQDACLVCCQPTDVRERSKRQCQSAKQFPQYAHRDGSTRDACCTYRKRANAAMPRATVSSSKAAGRSRPNGLAKRLLALAPPPSVPATAPIIPATKPIIIPLPESPIARPHRALVTLW